MLNLAIVVGSVRKGRQTHKAAYFLEKKLKQISDVNVKLIDLQEYNIPIFEESFGSHTNPTESLKQAAEILDNADAIILQSPEYHASMSGVLKNFMDYFTKEISRKPIGVVTASSGKFGGLNASSQMQQLIFGVASYPMPFKFIVPFISNAIDDNFDAMNEEVNKSGEKFINEFLWFANALTNAKSASKAAA